jgi:gamma-glutamylcyclotransferase
MIQSSDFYYFAYGSNMSTERLKDRIGDCKVISGAILSNHDLLFNKYSNSDGTGKANISYSKEKSVHGVVYKLAKEQLDRLDLFEGAKLSPPHYTRENMEVQLYDGSKVEVITYVAHQNFTREGLVPSQEYLDWILNGLKENGIKEGDSIKKAALAIKQKN